MTNEYNISFDWGKYVLKNAEDITGRKPDLIITGNDESRKGWFDSKDVESISEMIISRKVIDISGTSLRGYMIINDKKMWDNYMPKELENSFDELREELLGIPVYKDIYNKISNNLTIENFFQIYNKYEEEDKKDKLKIKFK